MTNSQQFTLAKLLEADMAMVWQHCVDSSGKQLSATKGMREKRGVWLDVQE
jgi:hypothetical protein